MNNFQTILVAIFLAFFVFAVLIFSGALKIGTGAKNSNNITGKVVIWGTWPANNISDIIQNLSSSNSNLTVSYVQKNIDTYQSDLVEAFANDNGPDIFILTPDMILKNNNFIYKIPYTSFSEKKFNSTFIDGANILLSPDGVDGYPLIVDPLVLYYNKDMLSNEGIVYPPSYWNELFNLGYNLTKKNKDNTIATSMIALGEYDNVNHAKDILSMLLLQSNNPIVTSSSTGYKMALNQISPDGTNPLESILSFFLEFSNPSKDAYDWNKSLPNSFDMFTSNRLAFYIGYASELFNIQSINPNLTFDVAMIPQVQGSNAKKTYGKIYTLVINKKSKNLSGAFGVSNLIVNSDFLKELSTRLSLPTAFRSLLSSPPKEAYLSTFFDSSIIAKSWLDPDSSSTDSIFKEMVSNISTNKLSTSEAISKASNQMDILMRNYEN